VTVSAPPPLPHNFHDGEIAALTFGPRRELTMRISVALLPPGHTAGTMPWFDYQLRFGGIDNYEEVRNFFSRAEPVSRIASLNYADDERSRANRLIVRLKIDDDSQLRIHCRTLLIWQNGDGEDANLAREEDR
jgi:hypothetical protein